MELALYHPRLGYYARAAQRSGRAGDFFTSVDVGPLFGELLASQIAEMAQLMGGGGCGEPFDFVEVGAGNGRLSADVLRAARDHHPELYQVIRAHLVEVSEAARGAQPTILSDVLDRLATSAATLPHSFQGVLLANELLDALPVHQVVMRSEGLREVYVHASGSVLSAVEGPLSTPALASYLDELDIDLEPGWRAEISLQARDWIADVARRLVRGFVLLIDYGHPAHDLYSASHAGGTLTAGARHTSLGPEARPDSPAWLERPGEVDLTAHVDFTTVRRAGETAGLTYLAFLDQTYFILGLADPVFSGASTGPAIPLKRRLALKTLLLPGGLGSTFKVLIMGKGVGSPSLRGCSYRVRAT